MSTMDFNGVTAGGLSAPGAIRKGLHHGVDVVLCHFPVCWYANAEKNFQLGVQHAVQQVAADDGGKVLAEVLTSSREPWDVPALAEALLLPQHEDVVSLRLNNISIGLCYFSSFHHLFISVSSKIYNRNIKLRAN